MSDWKNLVETLREDIQTKFLGHGWTVTSTLHLGAADIRCEPVNPSATFVDITRVLAGIEGHGLRVRMTQEGQALSFRITRPGPQTLKKWASNLCNWSATLLASLVVGGAFVWIAGTHPSLST